MIIKYIEDLKKNRMLVEDIQDIIEFKLMQLKKFELAKVYIIYRYTRALVRKSNLTDENILQIIKNKNLDDNIDEKKFLEVVVQKNNIAELVSTDITRRMLLPEKIVSAHDSGKIYFNKMGNFIHSMIDETRMDYEQLLCANKDKSFVNTCQKLAEYVIKQASNQSDKVYVDMSCLAKYYNYSLSSTKKKNANYEQLMDNELSRGIKTFVSMIENIITIHGKKANVSLILNPKDTSNYLITQKLIKEINDTEITYLLNKDNVKTDSKYYSATKDVMKLRPFITTYERFNGDPSKFIQGKITINLGQMVIESYRKNINIIDLLEERTNLCYEALMIKNHSLVSVLSDASPQMWQQGGISRLAKEERIDRLLKGSYSKLQIEYLGADAFYKYYSPEDATELLLNVINEFKIKIKNWQKASNIRIDICGSLNDKIANYFKDVDNSNYGFINELEYKNEILCDDVFKKMLLAKKLNMIVKVKQNEIKCSELISQIYNNDLFIKID